MYLKILGFVKHSAIYGLGGVATRILGFLLIPVYTRYLSPSDYGVLALCTTTVAMLKIVALGGMPSAIFRTYLLTARNDTRKERVIGTGLLSLLLWNGILVCTLLAFREPLTRQLFGTTDHSAFGILIALGVAFVVVPSLRNADFRIHDRSATFSLFSLLLFSMNLAAALYFVVGRGEGAWGALLATVTAGGILTLIHLPWCLGRLRHGFSLAMLKDMLGFAVPLIPTGIALWIMNLSDVYILRVYCSTEEVGLYNLGYRFGLGVYILTNALKLAFPKLVFSEAGDEQSPAMFSRIATYYIVVVGFIATVLATMAPQFIRIAHPDFHRAWTIVPFAVFAYAFFGLVSIVEVGIDIKKKIHYLALLFILGALLNIALNLMLIPHFGMMAAASTTLITYIFLALATYLVSRKLHPMRLEWGRLGKASGALLVVSGTAALMATDSFLPALATKSLLLGLYPLVLIMMGFFNEEEKKRLKVFWSSAFVSKRH